MITKQLILVVEGTAAVGHTWQTTVSDCLNKILRCFCGNGNEATGQLSTTHVELSLVIFGAHGSFNGCLVQRSGWTRDINVFDQWLSAISFTGLRHCILVAASNPCPLPTPAYQPQPQPPNSVKSESIETQSDAETLAKVFAQRSISLSIICPKQLPELRGIYNAGKRNLQAADPPVDNVKNPHFLVLISENFMEACTSLSISGMTSFQNMVTGSGASGMPSVTNMPLNQQSTRQSAKSKYAKIWEGNLWGWRQGQPVFITRLEGYGNVLASETVQSYSYQPRPCCSQFRIKHTV